MRDDSGGTYEVMEEDSVDPSKIFYDMKQRFLVNRTEESAINILNELLSVPTADINMDVWFDVKDLIVCLVETVTLSRLISYHQLLFLKAVNSSSGRVVDLLAEAVVHQIDDLISILASSHVAVTIAFARRITDPMCAESVAAMLWRFIELDHVQKELMNLLQSQNSEERFRVHQVTASMLKEGGDGEKVASLVQKLADEINSDDILCKLNAIELLADTASQRTSAAAYLVSTGMVDRLYNLLNQIAEHPDYGFLFPAAIKFFGHLSVAGIECVKRYPKFLDLLLDLVYHFDRLDPSLRLLAFDTLGVIASSDHSRLYLNSLSGEYDFEKAMNAFGVAIGTGPLELKVRHIEALTMLIRPQKPISEEASEVLRKWFGCLGEPFPALVVAFLTKPFLEIRIAALRLLVEVFNYEWAIRQFMETASFTECLLNRATETNAEGRQLKFDIVCRLIDSGSSSIPPETLIRMKLYRREGPFYVDRHPQVDMENE